MIEAEKKNDFLFIQKNDYSHFQSVVFFSLSSFIRIHSRLCKRKCII